MTRDLIKKKLKAQTMVEYTVILGIIVTVVFFMTPLLKRGIQGMIKITADQIGFQENADQRFDDKGHMEAMYSLSRSQTNKTISETPGSVIYSYNDRISTESQTSSNLGFTEVTK